MEFIHILSFVGDKLESLVEFEEIELKGFFNESEKSVDAGDYKGSQLPEKAKKESLFRRFLNRISSIRNSRKQKNFDNIEPVTVTKSQATTDDKASFEKRIRVDTLEPPNNHKTNETLTNREQKQSDGR